MMNKVIDFLRRCAPYLLAIALWRLSDPWWNPAGVLSLIVIFYSTFVRPIPMFGLFGVLICFLVDYKFDTVLFWTSTYLIMYAINGFQNFIDLSRVDKNAIMVFMIFFGAAIMILFLVAPSWTTLFRATWMYIWTTTLYLPITQLIHRARHD